MIYMYSYNSDFMFFILISSYKTVEKSGVGSSVRLVKYLQQNLFIIFIGRNGT